MLAEITGYPPVIWGGWIFGFSRCGYLNLTKKIVEWMVIGVSPRKANLTIYVMPSFNERADLTKALGLKVKTSVPYLYLKRPDDVDAHSLRALCRWAVETMWARYPTS